MCKISIIVPVYNSQNYLSNCIESILNQTFNDFELILVDDGSKDNSQGICNKYKEMDNRIKVIVKKNGGAASARNSALDIACGEYIGFIDSDDYIHKKMFEILYNIALEEKSDIVICDYINVYENNIEEIVRNRNVNLKLNKNDVLSYNNIQALNEIYTDEGIKFIIPCNKLFKRTLFNDLRYVEGMICEDEIMAHRVLYLADKISYIPVTLYYYLQTDNSVMRAEVSEKILDGVDALRDRVLFFKQKGLVDLRHKAEVNYVVICLDRYYKVQRIVSGYNRELSRIKREFIRSIIDIMKNPYYKRKEKISIALFALNSKIYSKFILDKGR